MDSAANPYLAFALLLAAGLKGIEEGYELPPEAEDNVWALTDAERRALGYDRLPASLDRALELHGGVASSSPRRSASRSSTTCCSTSAASGRELPRPGDAVRAGEQPRDPLSAPGGLTA